MIIERRDQVLIGFLDSCAFAFSIFSSRWPSTNGPFLIERPINYLLFHRTAITADHNKSVGIL